MTDEQKIKLLFILSFFVAVTIYRLAVLNLADHFAQRSLCPVIVKGQITQISHLHDDIVWLQRLQETNPVATEGPTP